MPLGDVYDGMGPPAVLGWQGEWTRRPETDAWRANINHHVIAQAHATDEMFIHLRTANAEEQTALLLAMSGLTAEQPLPIVLAPGGPAVDVAVDVSRVLRNPIVPQAIEGFHKLYERQLHRMINDRVLRAFAGAHAHAYLPVGLEHVNLQAIVTEFLSDSARAWWSAPARALGLDAVNPEADRLRDFLALL